MRALREELANSLAGETMQFAKLITYLGLKSEYEQYDAKSTYICDGLREKIPALANGTFYAGDTDISVKECMLVKWFESIYFHLESLDPNHYLSSPLGNRYVYENHESAKVPGTIIKPDGFIFYGDLTSQNIDTVHFIIEAMVEEGGDCTFMEALGQMAEYSHCVWQAQPTRVFIPVVYLFGVKMDLILFARSGYRRVALGDYLHKSNVVSKIKTDLIVDSIRRLWFLLIQPPEKFGHFVCVSSGSKCLQFEGSMKNTTVHHDTEFSEERVEIKGRFEREIPISRRTAYLLTVKYRGRDAVLKLAWTPVERQPEGMLYDILVRQRVECIPEVYRSGIIVRNLLGHCLEYILMEHCGQPINLLFAEHGQSTDRDDFLCSCAGNVIQKVCVCLLQAANAGVFHRDVSAGNITICNNKVFLIDWGFGKVIPSILDGQTKEHVNDTWDIDLDQITNNEDARDSITGTVLFMGIRVLMGLTSHSVFNDIESVLYAVLVALSYIGSNGLKMVLSEMSKLRNRHQALWKFGCMADSDDYPTHFGVTRCSSSLRRLLDSLRKILFEKDGSFIGGLLLISNEDVRVADEVAFKEIHGSKHFSECFPKSTLIANSLESSSASPKRKLESAAMTNANSSETLKKLKKQDN